MKFARTDRADKWSGTSSDSSDIPRGMRDLAALATLPSIWVDCDVCRSLQNLADVLRAALRAVTVCVRVELPDGRQFETAASEGLSNGNGHLRDATELLDAVEADSGEVVEIPRFNGSDPLNALRQAIFYEGRHIGHFVACFKEDVPPSASDRLLLHVAASQVMLLLQRHKDQEERFARRLAEDRLRQTEHHYQQLVQSLPAAVYTCDNEGRVTLYNEAAVKLWGRRPKIGEDMWCGSWRIFRPDGSPLPLNDCPMAIALREGRSVRGQEIIVERPDGTRAWVLPHPDPIRNESGKIVGTVNMLLQVDDLKRAEEELRRKTNHLGAFLETAALGLHRVGPDGTILWANEAEMKMLGYSPEEYIGHHISEFHVDEPIIKDILERLTCGHKLCGYEARLRCKDGSIKDVRIDSSVLWEDGKFIHTQCFTHDVTEQKRAEKALAAKVRQQRAVAGLGLLALRENNLQVLFDRAVTEVAQTLEVEYCKVLELLPRGDAVLLRAGVGWKDGLVGSATVSTGKESQAGYTLACSEPVVVKDLREETRFNGPPLLLDHGVVSGLSCIIVGGDRPWGVLGAHTKCYREFTEDDVAFLQAVANVLATSIQRKRAEQALQESKALLEGQKDAFQAAMKGSSLEESLEVLVRRAIELTGGHGRVAFYIASPDGKALHHVVGMHEHYAKCVDGYPVSGESMACGLAVYTGEPVIARDVEQDPKWEAYRWLARQHNFRACWSFPVRTKDGPVLGTLAMYFQEPCEPTPREMELATVIAHAATLIISRHQQSAERERAEQELRKRGERLQLLSETLGQLIGARDPNTIVRELFPKVAAHLGVDTYFNFMVNKTGDALELHSCAGVSDETARSIRRLEFGQAICGTVAQTRELIHAMDIQHSDYDKAALVREFGIQCYACNPLMVGDRLLGTLSFASRTRKEFDAEELQFLSMVSQHAAVALERLQFAQQLEKTVEERTASLREAIEQMEEFSYSVSHDLRGPLRAMNAYAGVLLEEYGIQLDEIARGYLEKIQRSTDRMNRLTQDVLAYGRVARSQAQLETIDLERLVRDVIHQHTTLQPPAAEIEIVGPLLPVLGHETTLGQSVSNLLNNAVKFVVPGVKPHVRIRSERNGKNVRVWFEDNGIGIKAEYQQRIFNMFERVHPEGKYEGTGIGLTIVRKAVEKMGGRVGVESNGHNGSRFWIELRSGE